MEKKKMYIFVLQSVIKIGGTQLYVAGKADYLEKTGWQVHMFFPSSKNEKEYGVTSLRKYSNVGGGHTFLQTPPYKFKRFEQDYFLKMIVDNLKIKNFYDCEIIIESTSGAESFWGEIIAAIVGGKHFVTAVHEVYNWGYFSDNLDFFYFKWKRNELVAGEAGCKLLFNGYKNVTAPLVEMPPTVAEMHPIQDVDFPIESLERLDWNICHIGRAAKDYVPYVIEGVGELARRHPDKKINFIMVGNADSRMDLLRQTFKNCPNVYLTLLGDMVPIPKILFSKVDVVCGISQSARFAANEGVLTICANANQPEGTPGVLGYDTAEQVHGSPTFTYVEALENVLVKRLYDCKKYGLPKLEPAEKYYENFWTIVKNASPVKEYYVKRLSDERIRNWTAIFPFASIARGARIVLFGATEIAKDYKKQIESQSNVEIEFGRDYMKMMQPAPYCEIVAVTDEHHEEFDDSVVSPELLKTLEYDAIIISTMPDKVQSAYNKIMEIVPQYKESVIYNFSYLIV